MFPVCELSSRERGDINNNVDPVLTIVDWAPRDQFPDLASPEPGPRLPPEADRQALPPPDDGAPPISESDIDLGREIDDSIPF